MSNGLRVPDVNIIMLAGRLTRDADVRYTTTGRSVARFRLASSRRFKSNASNEWQEETTFVDICLWGEAAERTKNRLRKGAPVVVEGRLRSHDWETKEGVKRSGIEVVARRVQFLETITIEAAPGVSTGPALSEAPTTTETFGEVSRPSAGDVPADVQEEEAEASLEGISL